MVWVCVWCVVQDHRLAEIPPQGAEIFDVVAEDAGTVVLIQTMSTRENIKTLKTLTPDSVDRVCLRMTNDPTTNRPCDPPLSAGHGRVRRLAKSDKPDRVQVSAVKQRVYEKHKWKETSGERDIPKQFPLRVQDVQYLLGVFLLCTCVNK